MMARLMKRYEESVFGENGKSGVEDESEKRSSG